MDLFTVIAKPYLKGTNVYVNPRFLSDSGALCDIMQYKTHPQQYCRLSVWP